MPDPEPGYNVFVPIHVVPEDHIVPVLSSWRTKNQRIAGRVGRPRKNQPAPLTFEQKRRFQAALAARTVR